MMVTTEKTADWLDGRLNPILVKEVRQGMQGRIVIWIVNLLLIALVVICVGTVMISSVDPGVVEIGQVLFMVLQGALFFATVSLLPGYAMFRFRHERSGENVDLYFITTLSPGQVVRGKFLATMSLVTMMFAVCIPFLLFTYLINGFDVPSMFVSLALGYMASAYAVMIALVIGAWATDRILGLIFAIWVFLSSMSMAITVASWCGFFLYMGTMEIFGSWESIAGVGFSLTMFALWMKLLEQMAVGLISAPSSDRTFGFRLWATIVLVVFAVGMFVLSFIFSRGHLEPEAIFHGYAPGAMCLVIFMLLVAISEPDGYSNRVLRGRPKLGLFRLLRLPYTSGATGGIAWCVVHVVFIAIVCVMAMALGDGVYSSDLLEWLPNFWGFICYIFAYALSARFLMRTLFRNAPSRYGWAVLVLLMGFLVLGSMFVAFVIDQREWDRLWVMKVFNPFAVFDDWDGQADAFILFAVGWMAVMFLANLPWEARNIGTYVGEGQARRFLRDGVVDYEPFRVATDGAPESQAAVADDGGMSPDGIPRFYG